MKRFTLAALGGLVLLGCGPVVAATLAVPADKADEAARYVAAMLVAGRGVVAANQQLINDPDKADKGFTPDFVAGQMTAEFEKATGTRPDQIADPDVKAAVAATLEASKKAIASNQARINQPGKAFKGFIPAVYGRITGNILKGESGIEIKQTTFEPRNAYNKPDDYEYKVLKQFESAKPAAGTGERVGAVYRYLQPVYIKQACLQCHGDPKGERDIAGKVKEGYKLGDLRGAISVTLPLR